MLVLSRKKEQEVTLHLPNGESVILKVLEIYPNRVSIGITAPRNIGIERDDAKTGPQPQKYTAPIYTARGNSNKR